MTSSNPKLGAGLHAATVYVGVGVSDQLPIPDSALMPAPNGGPANLVGAAGEYLRVGDRHTLRRTGKHVDGRTVGWTGRQNSIAPWLGLCAVVAILEPLRPQGPKTIVGCQIGTKCPLLHAK
jgi:hypothetical protein